MIKCLKFSHCNILEIEIELKTFGQFIHQSFWHFTWIMKETITYSLDTKLDAAQFKEILVLSTLGERRPIDDMDRLQQMLDQAQLLITAWSGNKLVGVSRAITDFSYCTYLADLAVDQAYQGLGIGTTLIKLTKESAPRAKLILLSAPKAVGYYPKIGMEKHPACYVLDDLSALRKH
jgi:predicted N-acetyltransferase YhbS